MSGLTTHILDTTHGRPAADVAVTLLREGAILRQARTNADGRCDRALLAGEEMLPGRYRLEFAIGAYFRSMGAPLSEPAFLEIVAIEFGIAEATGHYHVPLLVSPYGYSTYRGS